jgi:holo-[acyl-carrier protein] synthase
LGIGIDLVENARIAEAIARHGDAFLGRIFTAGEIAYCQRQADPAPHLAARFAAKEAVAKAFGCGIGASLAFAEIEVVRAESGAPSLRLNGKGETLARERRVASIWVSLSHTASHAIAQVILSQ